MKKFIVTIKMPHNPEHDPRNKKTGACPVSEVCTDVTGAHHSFLTEEPDEETLRRHVSEMWHITRIEEAL